MSYAIQFPGTRSLVNVLARAMHNGVPVYIANRVWHSEYSAFNKYVRPKGIKWEVYESEILPKVKALVAEFYARKRYTEDIYPQWEKVNVIHWGDNSIENEYYSPVLKKTRRIMVKAPNGDICF